MKNNTETLSSNLADASGILRFHGHCALAEKLLVAAENYSASSTLVSETEPTYSMQKARIWQEINYAREFGWPAESIKKLENMADCMYKPVDNTMPAIKMSPLTADEVWNNDDMMAINSKIGASMHDLMKLIEAVESYHCNKHDAKVQMVSDEYVENLANSCTPNTETGSLNYRTFAAELISKFCEINRLKKT